MQIHEKKRMELLKIHVEPSRSKLDPIDLADPKSTTNGKSNRRPSLSTEFARRSAVFIVLSLIVLLTILLLVPGKLFPGNTGPSFQRDNLGDSRITQSMRSSQPLHTGISSLSEAHSAHREPMEEYSVHAVNAKTPRHVEKFHRKPVIRPARSQKKLLFSNT